MFSNFNDNFVIVPADTRKLQQESYKLRYQIFCLEKEFFQGSANIQYLTECETDEYDDAALHNLLLYKPTQKYIGTVRLIQAKLVAQLPIEKAASETFYTNMLDYLTLPRDHLAEISRLAVLPSFRPKFAVLGLLRAIAQTCHQNDIHYFYAAMEPRIQRILQRLGLRLHMISPVIDYHGMRQCYIGFLKEIVNQVYFTHPSVWEILTDNGRLYPEPNIQPTYYPIDDQFYNYY